MGIIQEEHWSGLPFPSPGELSNPGIEPRSPTLWADTSTSEPPGLLPVLWEHTKDEKSEPWGIKGILEFLAFEEG